MRTRRPRVDAPFIILCALRFAPVSTVLPHTGEVSYEGVKGTVIGWGRLGERKKSSNILQKVDVPIISNEECKYMGYAPEKITKNMICAGYKEGQQDACQVNIDDTALIVVNDTRAAVSEKTLIIRYVLFCFFYRRATVVDRCTGAWILPTFSKSSVSSHCVVVVTLFSSRLGFNFSNYTTL